MPGPVKQFLDYSSNTANDTGENNAASVQPIANGETVEQTVLNRPGESLRQRTEAIRNLEADSLYLRDADRQLILAGPGKVTWPGSTTAAASGIPVIDNNLFLLPMLTPGFPQVTPVPPVASAFGALHLKRASDSMNSISVTSQRRSYAAGDQINVVVTPGAAFSCVLDVETTYQRTIKIVGVVGVTTLAQTITALNGLTPTAPDNTQLVLAALEGGAIGSDLLLTTQAKQYVTGNYDGERHTITPMNLADFFVTNPLQALGEGDSLCVNFPMVSDTASVGGRRQALPENSNTAIASGAFFNSRVHPENLVNALPICKVINGNLVFGTGVEIPAGATNVSLSTEDLGSRIMRNAGFEHGVTLSTARFGISDWENRSDLAVNGGFRLNTTTPLTGAKQLEFNQTSASAATGRIEQPQEIAVNPGQNIRVTAAVRQLIAPTAGQYSVVLYWGDTNSGASGNTTIALQVLASTDPTYRQIAQTVVVPAGKHFLKHVTIEVTGVTLGVPGVSLLVDDIQVVVETQTGMTPAVDNVLMRPQTVDAVIVEDPTTYALGQLAALLRMDKAVPALEGRTILERKDQDYTAGNLPPALALFGRLFQLGSKLLDSEAHALKPRVSADFAALAGVDFTLMWESGREGEVAGTYTQPVTRLYTSNDGQWIHTSNAAWGGATWTKDVAGQPATKFGMGKDGLRIQTRVSDVAWNDAAWAATYRFTNPLESASDARTPRMTMTGFDGASVNEFTQLFALNFTGYTLRLYVGHLTDNVDLALTFNAQWNGTGWVKDTSGKVSTRIYIGSLGATSADTSRLNIYHQTCKTTDTFPESDWTASPTTATPTGTGGTLITGRVYGGATATGSTPNPQGRLTAAPDGFGDGVTSSSFVIDSLECIETPNVAVGTYGDLWSNGGMIFEEFFNNVAPSGWQAATSGAGVVEFNYENLSRIRLNPGASDSAGIRTNGLVFQAAYSSFTIEMRYVNVLGKSQIGYMDNAANPDIAFLQDSAVYGDENIRLVVRTGAGLQVLNTGINVSTIADDWVKMRVFARGGTGLITTTSVFWRIQAKKGSGGGVFTPGGTVVNPGAGRVWRADAQNGALVVIDRVSLGGKSNFSL